MQQVSFQLSGSALRDAGMKQAQETTEAAIPYWMDNAMTMLREYLKQAPERFQGENFREWSLSHGLPKPVHLRAFGGVMVKASKLGLIKKIGVEPVETSTNHRAFSVVWTKS